jgi:hypothetical protein
MIPVQFWAYYVVSVAKVTVFLGAGACTVAVASIEKR